MQKRIQSPQLGGTYIMHTTEPRTIIFKFQNIGEYLVDGQLIRAPNHSTLAGQFAIELGPYNYVE